MNLSIKSLGLVSACLLITIFFSFCTIENDLVWWSDSCVYIQQAEYLLKGELSEFYAINKESMDLSFMAYGPYLYPMGWPTLLTFPISIFGRDFIALKVFGVLFSLAFLVVFFKLSSLHIRSFFLVAAIILFQVMNFHFWTSADYVHSEMAFLFFIGLSFLFFEKCEKLWHGIALGGIVFYSYFIRDVGAFLVPAFFLGFLFAKKDYKSAILFALTFIILFTIRNLSGFENDSVHLERLLSFSKETMLVNLNHSQNIFKEFFFPSVEWALEWSYILISVVLVLFCVASLLWGVKGLPYVVFATLQAIMIILWPMTYTQGSRFYQPFFPFIILVISVGFSKKVWTPYLNYFLLALFIGSFIFSGDHSINWALHQKNHPQRFLREPEVQAMFSSVKNNVREQDYVVYSRPRYLRFATGRNSFVQTANSTIIGSPASYLLYQDGISFGFEPDTSSNQYKKIDEGPSWRLYRIERKN